MESTSFLLQCMEPTQMHYKISSQNIIRCPNYYVSYSIRVYRIMSRKFNIQHYSILRHKFTGAFLYVHYSFLLISAKFCDLSLRRCSGRCRDMGGGSSVIRKIYCTGPWKLATIPLYNSLKSPLGAHVHKYQWTSD